MVAAKYAAQRARGKCCKMCVKKFDIRAMITSAEADHEKLRPVIEEKLKLQQELEEHREATKSQQEKFEIKLRDDQTEFEATIKKLKHENENL